MSRKVRKKINTRSSQNRHYSIEKKSLSLVELHELFIKFKLHGARNSKATIYNYRKIFDLLLQFDHSITLKDLQEETLIKFLEYLNTRQRKVGKEQIIRTYKNSSIAMVRSRLNVFFNWLLERNCLNVNPFEKIPYPEVSYTDRRAFSAKEFEKICFVVNTKIQWSNLLVKKRNSAIIMVLTFTGLRKEELLGLQLFDIDTTGKFISVRGETSKSKRSRIIPINSALIPYLEDYLIFRKNYSAKSFWVSGVLDRDLTEHGLKHLINLLTKHSNVNCHLHRFRHTFATNYYKQTHDIVGLKKLMGHRSLKMTLSYLRSLPDEHTVEQIEKISIDEFI